MTVLTHLLAGMAGAIFGAVMMSCFIIAGDADRNDEIQWKDEWDK